MENNHQLISDEYTKRLIEFNKIILYNIKHYIYSSIFIVIIEYFVFKKSFSTQNTWW